MRPAPKENLAKVVCKELGCKKITRERERESEGERERERERGRQTDRSCCKLLRKNINFIAIIKFNKYNLYATKRIKPNAGNNPQKEKADGQKKETACCIQ